MGPLFENYKALFLPSPSYSKNAIGCYFPKGRQDLLNYPNLSANPDLSWNKEQLFRVELPCCLVMSPQIVRKMATCRNRRPVTANWRLHFTAYFWERLSLNVGKVVCTQVVIWLDTSSVSLTHYLSTIYLVRYLSSSCLWFFTSGGKLAWKSKV